MLMLTLPQFALTQVPGKQELDAAKGKAADVQGKAKGIKGKLEAEKGKIEALKGKAEAEKGKIPEKPATKPAGAALIPPNPNDLLPERSIHGIELEKYLALRKPGMNTDEVWAKVSRVIIHPARYENNLLAGVSEVYGYHPFWMGSAWKSYNFELVNHVGYYAYPVDPQTGDPRGDMSQWLSTGLQDEAHRYGAKVDLVVALYGAAQTTAFLDNKAAQERLIAQTIDLLYGRGDGVNVDFQEVPASRKAALSAFIIHLQERLKLANPAYELRVTLPLIDREGVFEFEKYARVVTAFIVTGYDCYGARNARVGPSSVLMSSKQWRKPDVLAGIQSYLEAGLPTSQIVLSLPHYGKEWRVTTNDKGVDIVSIEAIRPYNFFLQPLDGKVQYDSLSSTAYRISKGVSVTRYYWWDDVASQTQKYEYVKAQGLRGIGIWALGYDNGRDELWELLRKEFAASKDTTDNPVVIPKRGRPYDHISRATVGDFRWIGHDTFPLPQAWNVKGYHGADSEFLLMYGKYDIFISQDIGLVINWILLILALFVELGFLLTLVWPETREYIFVKHRLLAYLLLFVTSTVPLIVLYGLGLRLSTSWSLVIVLGSLLLASLLSAQMVAWHNRPKP
jgi:Glycosyl hydrolases family 18